MAEALLHLTQILLTQMPTIGEATLAAVHKLVEDPSSSWKTVYDRMRFTACVQSQQAESLCIALGLSASLSRQTSGILIAEGCQR